MPPIKAPRRFAITITGDAEHLASIAPYHWDKIHYLLDRLMTGEVIAPSELAYWGISVEVAEAADGQLIADRQ